MKQTITYVFAMMFLTCLSVSSVWAQGRTVNGKVTDETGAGLPGATIIISGQANGTVTDLEGVYSLQVQGDTDELVYSFVGYETQKIVVGSRSVIDVSLQVSDAQLNEVVVVGYGTQEKSKTTGAITSLDAKDIENIPVPSFDEAIQGQIAGVNIQSQSGQPGAAVSIKIRGQNSVNLSSQPIYVLDGMIISGGDGGTASGGRQQAGANIMSTLNPADIESVTVLKDVSAAAIYGARSGNGVIMITTKKGSVGGPKVKFNTFYGVQSLRNKIDMANDELYRATQRQSALEQGLPGAPSWSEDGVNTDWQDELFVSGTEAYLSSQDISVSGGSENVSYFVSANHYDEKGIVRNTGLERIGIRGNTTINYGNFEWGNNLYVSTTSTDQMANFDASPLDLALRMPSNIELYNDSNVGGFGGPDGNDADLVLNPIAIQELNSLNNKRDRIVGNSYLQYEFIEGLTYRFNAGYDITNGYSRFYNPYWESGDAPNPLVLEEYRAEDRSWMIDNIVSYKKNFNAHSIGLMVGTSHYKSSLTNLSAATVPASETTPVSGAYETISSVGGGKYVWSQASVFGRFNYSYDDKYIVQFMLRRDGTSKFNGDNKWGTFPSVSAAWRVSNEGFMSGVSLISDLKLRASYGQAGNSNNGTYSAQSTLNQRAKYVFGNAQVPGATITETRNNPDLVWETVTELDFGLDVGLLNNSFILNVDAYHKTTSDLLLLAAVPQTTGYNQVNTNAGEMVNKGLDFSALYSGNAGDLQFNVTANIGFINNEITSLYEGNDITASNWGGINSANRIIHRVGEQAGSFYGFIFDGIVPGENLDGDGNVISAVGMPSFKDVAGPDGGAPDGVIDENDLVVLGSPIPDFIYGFGANASYKGFDFSFSFYGSQGNEIFSTPKFNQLGFYRTYNVGAEAANAWTTSNTDTDVQSASVQDTNISSRWVEDGSFLRLKNIQLGYTFKTDLVSSLRLYVSGRNLLTVTGYDDWGYDPEVGASGIDNIAYPKSKAVLVGLNVSF